MANSKSRRKKAPKRVLALPDLEHAEARGPAGVRVGDGGDAV